MKAPQAKKIEKTLEIHGDQRMDPYFWLNERENPEVLRYLEEENSYADFMMKDTEELQEELFEEMKSRYKKDDESLPYFFNGYWYIVRYEEGKEYPIFCRKQHSLDRPEEIIVDVNILAEGESFFEVGSVAVSPDNLLASFSADNVGRRIYTINFKDLQTGEILPDKIPNTTGKAVWANDNKHVFYIRKDTNLRAFQVYRHQLGTDPSEDVLIFHEEDDTFDVNVFKTKSLKYIFIASSSTISDEHRFIPSDDVFADWTVIQPRMDDLEYSVEHYEDEFYIITNADDATNFKIVKTKISQCSMDHWVDVIPHRENVLLEGFEIFRDYLVLEEREQGLLQIKIINEKNGESYYLPFSDPTYTAYIGINLEFDTDILRYGYTSLTQPGSTYEYNMKEKTTQLLKQQEVLGGKFSPENYISERIWADSRDGKTKIPVSLVYHKDTVKSGDTPLLLYGYGSYGHTVDASFSNVRLSLLDRGFIYAIAHIRGGEYLGREWYEEGKMLYKKNTFFDFIDAGKFLIRENYTSSKHLYAMGGSAGGLLMGAVVNFEPKLFNGIVAQVPFVDVVTTMLDETIPLTTGEYDEWGNPNDREYYDYMKSYSPYDNVEAKDYPHMLITTGLHDSQVQYWEPAKWVARLRELKTDDHLLIFKTDMSAGHGGASGRFESLKEDALEYAFLIKLENKN
ncbi:MULTISPECIES: S9 family peptidase [Chryseobacterium]|uniref:Oligopeptidase B n=1 Tax=Chryseobacterium camelliae TaxID=1265445 RepID=A0ABU0TN90_9FLAO|nr:MULTISPECIES: S9 family peptidase [Chryseobacterium]MDT3407696.1 oligopeptidase B [Pseudacidovorax intermedius]MDQ1098451.1 oligopeptidase B [Chryseobacterium camelliae]MDQ1102375.1 oligopeptidase B [Chryseobacterium sp. SORGH_AS_1048]MDR6085812.1 oligopeptidase B [Chryseobacterium sp. SORGH_AS_0909]MDR6130175.1 oligopeptidase B [Chryseobacterium sp. SORGH_AS_1175]